MYFNGKKVSEEELMELLKASQEATVQAEADILASYPGIDEQCASYICYLRSRSRWTIAKELELVRMNRAKEPLPNVYAGDF